jgi:hypothetical protein
LFQNFAAMSRIIEKEQLAGDQLAPGAALSGCKYTTIPESATFQRQSAFSSMHRHEIVMKSS